MKRPTLIYVSGPLTTGDTIGNIRRAVDVGNTLIERGYIVIVPHEKALCLEIMHPRTYEQWLAYDFKCIRRCDALYRMSGTSAGGDAEVAFATRNSIPVYFFLDTLFCCEPVERQVPHSMSEARRLITQGAA